MGREGKGGGEGTQEEGRGEGEILPSILSELFKEDTLEAKKRIKSNNGIPTMGNGKMVLLFRFIIKYRNT